MDIEFLLKLISSLLSTSLVWYVWRMRVEMQVKILFTFTIASFLTSMLLSLPESESKIYTEWIRHVPFYTGQIFLYILLKNIIKNWQRQKIYKENLIGKAFGIMGIPISLGLFSFVTEQGLQHLITLPFFFLITAFTRIEYAFIESTSFKSILNFFLWGGLSLTMIHVGEFLVESQGLLQFLEGEGIEVVEFLWYYISIALFGFGFHRMASSDAKLKQQGI